MNALSLESRIEPSPWRKRCSCGIEYTRQAWESLTRIGFQLGVPTGRNVRTNGSVDAGPSVAKELRNCTCGSTLLADVMEAEIVHLLTRGSNRLYASGVRTLLALLEERCEAAMLLAREFAREAVADSVRRAELEKELLAAKRKVERGRR